MQTSVIIMIDVLFELLFVFCLILGVRGYQSVKKSADEIILSRFFSRQLVFFGVASLLAQVAFWPFLLWEKSYIFSMLSSMAMIYAYILSTECLFAHKKDSVWIGYTRYEKGALKDAQVFPRFRGQTLNVFFKYKGKQVSFKTTPENWEKIQTLL